MIDINLIRSDPELVKKNIKKKFQEEKLHLIDKIKKLDVDWRNQKMRVDKLRHDVVARVEFGHGREAARVEPATDRSGRTAARWGVSALYSAPGWIVLISDRGAGGEGDGGEIPRQVVAVDRRGAGFALGGERAVGVVGVSRGALAVAQQRQAVLDVVAACINRTGTISVRQAVFIGVPGGGGKRGSEGVGDGA